MLFSHSVLSCAVPKKLTNVPSHRTCKYRSCFAKYSASSLSIFSKGVSGVTAPTAADGSMTSSEGFITSEGDSTLEVGSITTVSTSSDTVA